MKATDHELPATTDREGTSRRQFCHAATLGVLAAIAQACGSSSNPAGPGGGSSSLPVVTGTLASGVITVAIDSTSPLANVGSVALVQAGNAAVLVARTGQSSFAAVSGTCTHQACPITGYSGSNYVCPCHGSQFSTTGQVLTGPASRNLPTFSTSFASNVLTIGA